MRVSRKSNGPLPKGSRERKGHEALAKAFSRWWNVNKLLRTEPPPPSEIPAPNGLPKSAAAFTLAEAMIAVGVTGIFVAACVWSIVSDQVCLRKAKEEAIGMNFLTKYIENVKALPFASVAPGLPINGLYDGLGGAALITIPSTNTSWVPVNTTAFETFYPDLLWLTNRNPAMLVTLTENSLGGALHDIEINVRFDWDAPLTEGGRLEVMADCLRTADVPTL
jgi:hypothetical protein